jgi:hypothetical protein
MPSPACLFVRSRLGCKNPGRRSNRANRSKAPADDPDADRAAHNTLTEAHCSQMATRQERIDAFDHEGSPPTDEPLEILCEDHVGTYVIPFLCRWHDGVWQSVETGSRIEAAVIGWREPQ